MKHVNEIKSLTNSLVESNVTNCTKQSPGRVNNVHNALHSTDNYIQFLNSAFVRVEPSFLNYFLY